MTLRPSSARAKEAGLERVMVILEARNQKEAAQAAQLERLWPETRFAIGVHPHQAHEFADDPERTAAVVQGQLESTPGARAVGEIGLDYHYDFSPPRRAAGPSSARSCGSPASSRGPSSSIHARPTTTRSRFYARRVRGSCAVCCTASPALRRWPARALDLGFYVSLAGIITFPKATFPKAAELRDTVRAVPIDRLLTETDSPFLAPVPHRGKRNEPAHVGRVVAALAALYHVDAGELAARTAANFPHAVPAVIKSS